MKRAALYVRVSTQEQKLHGQSVDSQIDALRQYCKDNGIKEVCLYNDAGYSASKRWTTRPAMSQMISDAQAKKFDIILITKLDRFFRSVSSYYSVMDELHGMPWRAIWEDYETETSSGVFKVNIMLSVAQAESDRTSERVKAVNNYKRSKGEYVGGKSPTGYILNGNSLVIDEEMRDVMQKFLQSYLATFSISNAMNVAKENGLQLTRQRATRILQSDVYCGNPQGYFHCEPYITEQEHEVIKKSFGNRRHREKSTDEIYLFTGLIVCPECGRNMSSKGIYIKHKHMNKCYKYKGYACPSNSKDKICKCTKHIFESTIEKYLLSELDNIIENRRLRIECEDSNRIDVESKIISLKAKLDRIGVRFEDGDISVEEYKAKRENIKREIESLKPTTTPMVASIPDNWRDMYDGLDDQHKKAFWNRVIYCINIEKDGSFSVV